MEEKNKRNTGIWEKISQDSLGVHERKLLEKIKVANKEMPEEVLNNILFSTYIGVESILSGVEGCTLSVFEVIFHSYLYSNKLTFAVAEEELRKRRIDIYLPSHQDGNRCVWTNLVRSKKKFLDIFNAEVIKEE
ncbi:hypothetical protein GYA37_03575 [candidate division WWE3 bacterium]|uniref:Uncharacterized protein n=1 Tax=candidate division WWE3 bacterium TaxID=2053526 RepID=A0A7X9HSZ2_UNCKA|nr:hypothetical protein [candidate division WWE3 bacterium]